MFRAFRRRAREEQLGVQCFVMRLVVQRSFANPFSAKLPFYGDLVKNLNCKQDGRLAGCMVFGVILCVLTVSVRRWFWTAERRWPRFNQPVRAGQVRL